jgi:hypothetical protein
MYYCYGMVIVAHAILGGAIGWKITDDNKKPYFNRLGQVCIGTAVGAIAGTGYPFTLILLYGTALGVVVGAKNISISYHLKIK